MKENLPLAPFQEVIDGVEGKPEAAIVDRTIMPLLFGLSVSKGHPAGKYSGPQEGVVAKNEEMWKDKQIEVRPQARDAFRDSLKWEREAQRLKQAGDYAGMNKALLKQAEFDKKARDLMASIGETPASTNTMLRSTRNPRYPGEQEINKHPQPGMTDLMRNVND